MAPLRSAHRCFVLLMPLWRLYGLLREAFLSRVHHASLAPLRTAQSGTFSSRMSTGNFSLSCPQGVISFVSPQGVVTFVSTLGGCLFLCFFLSPGNMKRTSRQAVARNSKRGKAKSAYLREGCKRCLPVWRDVCDRTAAGHLPSAMLGCGRRRQQVE